MRTPKAHRPRGISLRFYPIKRFTRYKNGATARLYNGAFYNASYIQLRLVPRRGEITRIFPRQALQ